MENHEIAALRPDIPQWVDLRGFLLSGRCDVFANPRPHTGFIVRSWDFPAAFAAGSPEPDTILAAVRGNDASGTSWAGPQSEDTWHLLAPPESVEAVSRALGDWTRSEVTLHEYDPGERSDWVPVDAATPIRLFEQGWESAGITLDHLPDTLREEYWTGTVRGQPMVVAFVAEVPAAFCYAAVMTESLWDVAVDTLPAYRRRGLAAACFSRLTEYLAGQGRRPVWGAINDNEPSMALAAKLGFRPAATLVSFEKESERAA